MICKFKDIQFSVTTRHTYSGGNMLHTAHGKKNTNHKQGLLNISTELLNKKEWTSNDDILGLLNLFADKLGIHTSP